MLATYLSVTFALVITPGASTATVVRNTVAGGLRAGARTAAGCALGNCTHATAAGLGLAWLLGRFPDLLGVLRLAGALYLLWLAFSAFRLAWRGGLVANAPVRRPGRGPLVQGLLVNLLNPSVITFYLIVVPTFLTPGAPPWMFAALAAIHVTMALTCHLAWSVAFDRLRHVVGRPAFTRTLEALAGAALLVLAVRMLSAG